MSVNKEKKRKGKISMYKFKQLSQQDRKTPGSIKTRKHTPCSDLYDLFKICSFNCDYNYT